MYQEVYSTDGVQVFMPFGVALHKRVAAMRCQVFSGVPHQCSASAYAAAESEDR